MVGKHYTIVFLIEETQTRNTGEILMTDVSDILVMSLLKCKLNNGRYSGLNSSNLAFGLEHLESTQLCRRLEQNLNLGHRQVSQDLSII